MMAPFRHSKDISDRIDSGMTPHHHYHHPKQQLHLEPLYLLYDERMLLHCPVNWVEPQVYPECGDDTDDMLLDDDYALENPERLRVIYERLVNLGNRLLKSNSSSNSNMIFQPLSCKMATKKQVLLAHSEAYYERMDQYQFYSDTELVAISNLENYYCRETFNTARLAAGGLIACVDAVCSGGGDGGVGGAQIPHTTSSSCSNKSLALVRPPGHHACQSKEMGFCFIDSVVVAAKYALKTGKAKRIAILDWDIHDGNGTSEATIYDPNIFRIDLHRYNPKEGFYPYTGAPNEVGFGQARGLNLNVGWSQGGVRNQEYAAAFYELVLPLLVDYEPDLLIISCGLDAAKGDLLGGCDLTPVFYHAMTRATIEAIGADTPLVCALEGGYAMNVLPDCMEAVTLAMLNCPYDGYHSLSSPEGIADASLSVNSGEPDNMTLTSDRLVQARHVLSPWYRRDRSVTCMLQYEIVQDINTSIRIFKGLERWSHVYLQRIKLPPKPATLPQSVHPTASRSQKKKRNSKKRNRINFGGTCSGEASSAAGNNNDNTTVFSADRPFQRPRIYMWYGTEWHHQAMW